MLEMAREVIRFSFYDPPTVIAVGWAESRGNTNAVGVVTALRPDGSPLPWHGSRDRGVYQINSYFHPEVSDACAFSEKKPSAVNRAGPTSARNVDSISPGVQRRTLNGFCSPRSVSRASL